ncbi:hypothetical protein LSTR_LSTR015034 [Laodelphax striatellus]|uniref:Uncharacterized protein n=1 Tax=Laodelphax striatellus TaxID=195883 RepID=A0A482XBX2_LAOST|nr:hypothetical protein LSTR_LSTR015034 [Laodelphax striatellus]
MVMETITLDDTDEEEPKLPELSTNMLKDNKVAEPKSAPWKSTMKGSCIEISSDEDDDDDDGGAKSLALQDFETSSYPENIITISSEDDDGQDEDDDDDG